MFLFIGFNVAQNFSLVSQTFSLTNFLEHFIAMKVYQQHILLVFTVCECFFSCSFSEAILLDIRILVESYLIFCVSTLNMPFHCLLVSIINSQVLTFLVSSHMINHFTPDPLKIFLLFLAVNILNVHLLYPPSSSLSFMNVFIRQGKFNLLFICTLFCPFLSLSSRFSHHV